MAQQQTAPKKGWLYRVMMGKDDLPDFEESKLPGNRWQVFKDIFAHQFGKLVKVNLLVVLFCLPLIAWMVYCLLNGILTDAYVNYTGNLGFGMGATADADLIGNVAHLQLTVIQFSILIPCLMIAAIGFAGAFHTYKQMIWQNGVMVTHTFFKGIKENWLTFLWTSVLLGAGILLVAFNAASLGLQNNTAVSILSIIASSILLVVLIFMAMFMWTQTVTYKMTFWQLVKNSFLFSIGMLLQNIFFIAISIVPILLIVFLPMNFAMLFLLLYILVGFSYTFLVWTVYAHYCFDRTLNNYTPGAIKDRGIRRVTKEEAEQKRQEAAERRRKANNMRYANPKKGKRTAAESDITPLSTTYSRKDLERLAEEKKRLADIEQSDAQEERPEEEIKSAVETVTAEPGKDFTKDDSAED